MLDAKDILVKLKGDNKDFKGAMAGANTSMKGFATTTTSSTAVAATSTKAMSLSMAASLAIATVGLTALIGGVVALVGALGKAVSASAEDAEATARTAALLEQQGIAWESVGDHVLNYIEDLERLTLYGDTELQTSFNELIASGMGVEGALEGMSAAAAIANSTELSLTAATQMLGKEFTTGTSRLKNYGIEADNFEGILAQVNETMGDGGHVTDTASGKFELLKIELMDQAKVIGTDLLPVISDVLTALIWGAKNVLPPLIHAFKILIIPIKSTILAFEILVNTATAAWEALHGNFDIAKAHLESNLELSRKFNEESKATILNIKEENAEIQKVGESLENNLTKQESVVLTITEQNKKTEEQISLQERLSQVSKGVERTITTGVEDIQERIGKAVQWAPTPYPDNRIDLTSGGRSGL